MSSGSALGPSNATGAVAVAGLISTGWQAARVQGTQGSAARRAERLLRPALSDDEHQPHGQDHAGGKAGERGEWPSRQQPGGSELAGRPPDDNPAGDEGSRAWDLALDVCRGACRLEAC